MGRPYIEAMPLQFGDNNDKSVISSPSLAILSYRPMPIDAPNVAPISVDALRRDTGFTAKHPAVYVA